MFISPRPCTALDIYWCIRVLQRDRKQAGRETERRKRAGEREKEEERGERRGERERKGKDDIKELVQVILGAEKSKIYKASWQARDLGNS